MSVPLVLSIILKVLVVINKQTGQRGERTMVVHQEGPGGQSCKPGSHSRTGQRQQYCLLVLQLCARHGHFAYAKGTGERGIASSLVAPFGKATVACSNKSPKGPPQRGRKNPVIVCIDIIYILGDIPSTNSANSSRHTRAQIRRTSEG